MTQTKRSNIAFIRTRFDIPFIEEALEWRLAEDRWFGESVLPKIPDVTILAHDEEFLLLEFQGLVWRNFRADTTVELVEKYTINDDGTFTAVVFPSGTPGDPDDPSLIDPDAWEKTDSSFVGYRRGGYPTPIDGKICIVHSIKDTRKPLTYLGETVVNDDLYQFYLAINPYRTGDEYGYVLKNGVALHPNLRVEKIDVDKVTGYLDVDQTDTVVFSQGTVPQGFVPVEDHSAITLPADKIGLYPDYEQGVPGDIDKGDYFLAQFSDFQHLSNIAGTYVFYWNEGGGKAFCFHS